jgi:hypothetical protein
MGLHGKLAPFALFLSVFFVPSVGTSSANAQVVGGTFSIDAGSPTLIGSLAQGNLKFRTEATQTPTAGWVCWSTECILFQKTPFMGGYRIVPVDTLHQDYVPFGPFQAGQGFIQPIVASGTYFTKVMFTFKNSTTGAIYTPAQPLYSAELVVP